MLVDLGNALAHGIEFSAPAYSQKVTATISPESCSVSAYLIRSADKAVVEDALEKNKDPEYKYVLAGEKVERKAPSAKQESNGDH